MLHLATAELRTSLSPSLAFLRDLTQRYLTRLCHLPGLEGAREIAPIPAAAEEMEAVANAAPPMRGLEYLSAEVLAGWWAELDGYVRAEIAESSGGAQAYLQEKNPVWRLVGRVTFHLAENKRDERLPFAFLATYANRLSAQGSVRHLPLSQALQEYAGAKNRAALVALLTPIQRAAEACDWVEEIVASGAIYRAMAWTPKEAHRFLRDVPVLEESGLVVRVPDWWKPNHPPRPQVQVTIGQSATGALGAASLLDFSLRVTIDGEIIGDAELNDLLASSGGLVALRGRWVEVDREKLAAALAHWKVVERGARRGGITFFEGMRLLAGADLAGGRLDAVPDEIRQWTGISAGEWLDGTLAELRNPQGTDAAPRALRAELRPYQLAGVHWLRFLCGLGLGACLADDMGLGKTIQVLALLLHLYAEPDARAGGDGASLLVVPASLIGNWKSEIANFAPALKLWVAHPSEGGAELKQVPTRRSAIQNAQLVMTTYGMLPRLEFLSAQPWNLLILDEAQAIKNPGTRQAKAVKALRARGRVALTGTPVENRVGDLWSLFDFLNPGLLGGAKTFAEYVKKLERLAGGSYAPLRALVRPYILRRLKTDKRIIADLPEKTEVVAYCGLSKQQAALYEQSVRELRKQLESAEGIQRRGIVLAYLARFKQICNHPSQWLGDGAYEPGHSGKFHRLGELAEELAARQEKALIFTQFRAIAEPLAEFLGSAFGRPGLILHGETPVAKRREMVEAFQRDEGPPFFVLSLKAGGTGLNLTAAAQVIHFDRWWNPAVENQATDRAFRIGQKKNVLVHKFVCRGTVEEKIDRLIAEKIGLSRELLEGGAERMLTEMDNGELLRFVALDINKAAEE